MKQPWGSAMAMLAACGITLLGVYVGLEPDVILLRAIAGAALLGGLTVVLQGFVGLLSDGE